jgi:CubicO group peptidase (beta-lactamase class C family)/biotin carboxylase
MSLKRGPEVPGAPVTAYNWQDPPFNRWAFWHVSEILPTYLVSRGTAPARVLPASATALDLRGVAVPRIDGSAGTAGEVLDDTFTDAYAVLQDGELVTEWYGPLGAPDRPHALMSVSKSVVGCVAAVLIDRGQLDPEALLTAYVPELAASGFAGATVRHVLDMRSGVAFLEEYANPHADIRRMDEWIGWDGSDDGGPRGLYRFLATLAAEAPHGSRFLYRSAESDVLGWVCERAAGRPMAELISALVWSPMGAEHDARLLRDGLGTAVHDGGLCATVRDVARFGQLLLDGGVVPDGTGGTRRVVPPRWLRDGWAVDADVRSAFAASPAEAAFPGGWYRNQFWFRPGAYGDVLLGLGIYGQMLHVSRRTNTVCVKFSSWPQAQNPAYLEDTLRAFDAIGGALAGRDPTRGRRLTGVVSGLSRRGDTVPPSPPNVILTAQPRRVPRRRLTWRYVDDAGSSGALEARVTDQARRHLNGIAEIRTFFRTNQQPIYFVGPTAFNLLGIDRWVRNFQYVAYYDSWDGQHPRVFTPENRPYIEFESSEQINNYLLRDPEVREHLRRRGGVPMVAMVFFDSETEEICRELGYDLILPPDSLRRRLDSKIVTTQLGNEAGAPSVPNVLGKADSYAELTALASGGGLGTDLVVQTPYGDSGKTTFFIASEPDWDACAADLGGQELKVMKRINNHAAAVEACITRHGTIVGPFMTDLTGYPELTPYKGGWCGNDLFPEALSEADRAVAIGHVRKLGDRLAQEGYKGFLEVDVLVDVDTGTVYLGELNPRISGVSSMTNVTAGAYADVPLFLFHLLEFMDVDYMINVEEINERWRDLAAVDVWSQLIMKEPGDEVERILAAPRTGAWRLADDGSLTFEHISNDWHEITTEDEAFFMRVYGPGEYRFHGADLGILVTKGRMQTAEGLTERCHHYIEGIRGHYQSEPLPAPPPVKPVAYVK